MGTDTERPRDPLELSVQTDFGGCAGGGLIRLDHGTDLGQRAFLDLSYSFVRDIEPPSHGFQSFLVRSVEAVAVLEDIPLARVKPFNHGLRVLYDLAVRHDRTGVWLPVIRHAIPQRVI